jgi:hypothetical protein
VKAPNIEVIKHARGNGRLVVRDGDSDVVHVVTTRLATERYIATHM